MKNIGTYQLYNQNFCVINDCLNFLKSFVDVDEITNVFV